MTEPAETPTIDHAFTGDRKGPAHDPTYAGALSFMRRRYSKDIAGCDAVVWGVPFDLAVSNRPRTRCSMPFESLRHSIAETMRGMMSKGMSFSVPSLLP